MLRYGERGEALIKTAAFKETVNGFGLHFMGGLQNLVIERQLDYQTENKSQRLTDQLVKMIVMR